MTEKEFGDLLLVGHELRDVEFKAPGKSGRRMSPFLAKVVRAILGMANIQDGGRVIIGVEEEDSTLLETGLDEDQLESWKNYDAIAELVNGYATPTVSFERDFQLYKGRTFVILKVNEFAEIPILCRHEYHDPASGKAPPILRRGACYVRSRHKPETAEIRSEEEMRGLLDLAIEKGVRNFLRRAQRVGLYPSDRPVSSDDVHDRMFEKQQEDIP
ncbi:MAG: ATP-binding protein [Isosphaeraceae bacterium]|nr:ATP-binding protein [Isosphaeraceae bacterium]